MIRKILEENGFEPDKTIATMSEEQLYKLIRFAVLRTINKECK